MIEIKKLTKKYNTALALDNFSVKIKKSEITGILGPNGAGKTTLIKILTCFMYPTAGSVTIEGFDIYKDSLKIRELIGYLPENAPLYNDLNVYDYLEFIAKIRKLPKKMIKQKIEEVSKLCDISSVAYKKIDNLSKGYRQRVGLAQSIIHDPAILIFDEPTSGLDPNQIIETRELIKELGKSKTVIFSSHILQEVQAVCDRIIIISNGKIVGDGAPDTLYNKNTSDQSYTLLIRSYNSLLNELKEVKNIATVEEIVTKFKDQLSYNIVAKSRSDIREDIFNLCVKNNSIILEFKKEPDSLEKIFKELTLG
ncbi:MAG: ATP-binding cassette domain-containing protein [Candidatus Delongbacteria bacterium]|nr:ATP-binding cassette domain-containing protein [Candidatus Delongbacteria bacterium]